MSGRGVRGTALAVLSALVTVTGHVAGGGSLPDASLLLVLLPLLAAAFVSVAERARNLPGTVAVLGAGQLVLHLLLTTLHPAHERAVPLLVGPSMLLWHAAATLVLAVAVRHADTALTALAAALGLVLPPRLTPLPADRPLTVRPVPSEQGPARLRRALAAVEARRGPPVGC